MIISLDYLSSPLRHFRRTRPRPFDRHPEASVSDRTAMRGVGQRPEVLDGAGRVVRAEHGCACDEDVCPRLGAPPDSLFVHATVDLQPDLPAMPGDQLSCPGDLG